MNKLKPLLLPILTIIVVIVPLVYKYFSYRSTRKPEKQPWVNAPIDSTVIVYTDSNTVQGAYVNDYDTTSVYKIPEKKPPIIDTVKSILFVIDSKTGKQIFIKGWTIIINNYDYGWGYGRLTEDHRNAKKKPLPKHYLVHDYRPFNW